MRSRFTLLAIVCAVCTVLAEVRPAWAQTPQRPFRGLFGGAQPANTRGQMVDLSMSAFVGWDEPQPVVNPSGSSSSDDRTLVSGPFSGGSAAVVYTHPGEHFSFTGSGSAFSGYFPDNKDNPWYDSYAGFADLAWRADLTRRTHFHFSSNVNGSTDFGLGTVLGTGGAVGSIDSATGTFENALVHQPSVNSMTQAELAHDFSAKSNGMVSYGFQFSHFFNSDDFPDYGTHTIGGRYQHRLTKDLGYHLGYSYGHTQLFGGEGQPVPGIHNIDVGMDYGRALSLTRTTHFTFAVGTAVTTSSQVQDGETTFSSPHVNLVGNVRLTQELGRSWALSSFYDRSVSYEPGFSQPGLFDTAGAYLTGLISRRVDVSTGATYQVGRIGLQTQNYRQWNVSAQIRGAITRNIAAYASYYYLMSDVGSDVLLPAGVPRSADRNGVRAGVTAWLPLWYGRGAP